MNGIRAATVTAVAAVGLVFPTGASADVPDPGWHRVQEKWQPYPESALTLPAQRYCGDFDLRLEVIRQGVRVKALTRWDNGLPRTELYAGPLQSRAVNLRTGATADLNLSGTARVTYRATGSMETYEMSGPVGMGWPEGSGSTLAQGYYRFVGHHVVSFAEDGTRALASARGAEQDVCAVVR